MNNKPHTIDRYQIRRVLGTGAMGHVWAAWDPKLHREVAIKVVPARLSSDKKCRERFQREARAIAAVRHSNIVEIYDYSGDSSPYLYLVMEKLEGEDLYSAMSRSELMPEAVAVAIAHELCLALQVAHDAGIIHRDIKPENVFLIPAGRVVLTDFGIVKAIKDDSAIDGYQEATEVIGTPGFMAPELMRRRHLSPAVDIFSIGALVYNIATKHMPFEGGTGLDVLHKAAVGKFADPRTYNPLLSDEFCSIVQACLHPDAKHRPASAEHLRQALKAILATQGVTDVRDEIRHYIADSVAYARMAQQRLVQHLVDGMQLAGHAHDKKSAQKLRNRVLALDPANSHLDELDATVEVARKTERNGVRWPSFTPSWWATGIAASLVASLVYLASQWSPTPAPVRVAEVPNLPQAAAQLPTFVVGTRPDIEFSPYQAQETSNLSPSPKLDGIVDVQIIGGPATLMIDGETLGQLLHHSISLTPGHHCFDIIRRGHRWHRDLDVADNAHISVLANLRDDTLVVSES